MNETLTLSQAIAKAFSLSDVPEFVQAKPVSDAVTHLKQNDIDAEFVRGELRPGVVAFHNGGAIAYAVVVAHEDLTPIIGGHVIGTIVAENYPKTPKNAKKARKTAKKGEKTVVDESNVAPVNDESNNTDGDDTTESE